MVTTHTNKARASDKRGPAWSQHGLPIKLRIQGLFWAVGAIYFLLVCRLLWLQSIAGSYYSTRDSQPVSISIPAAVVGAVIALTLGAAFYWVRCTYRLAYGVSEVVIGTLWGAVVVVCACDSPLVSTTEFITRHGTLTVLLGLGSAIYIVVRGFDNISEGRKQKRA